MNTTLEDMENRQKQMSTDITVSRDGLTIVPPFFTKEMTKSLMDELIWTIRTIKKKNLSNQNLLFSFFSNVLFITKFIVQRNLQSVLSTCFQLNKIDPCFRKKKVLTRNWNNSLNNHLMFVGNQRTPGKKL